MALAMTVVPGRVGSAAVTELDGPAGVGDVIVDGVAVGICGTDREIAAGRYGTAPDGASRLVIGHESLGRVRAAPAGSGLEADQLVAGIVRRPDPEPCPACAVGQWDQCRNGRYTERGIRGLDGYGAQRWRVESDFAVAVPEQLGRAGVLVEPASVVAKAWERVDRIVARTPGGARRALVTGAGPIGLLAALLGRQRGLEVDVLDRVRAGPKPDLVSALGARYHTGAVSDVPEPDVVIECTGAASVVVDVVGRTRSPGIVCLTGVSSGGRSIAVDVGALNRELVLENDTIFGSVNANRDHYRAAVEALASADRSWLAGMITRSVPLDRWTEALDPGDDVKVVVELAG